MLHLRKATVSLPRIRCSQNRSIAMQNVVLNAAGVVVAFGASALAFALTLA